MSKRWEPVKPGFEIACESQPDWKLYASEGDIGVINATNREEEFYVYARPHNLALCELVPAPPVAPVPVEVVQVLWTALYNLRNDIAFGDLTATPETIEHMSKAYDYLTSPKGANDE